MPQRRRDGATPSYADQSNGQQLQLLASPRVRMMPTLWRLPVPLVVRLVVNHAHLHMVNMDAALCGPSRPPSLFHTHSCLLLWALCSSRTVINVCGWLVFLNASPFVRPRTDVTWLLRKTHGLIKLTVWASILVKGHVLLRDAIIITSMSCSVMRSVSLSLSFGFHSEQSNLWVCECEGFNMEQHLAAYSPLLDFDKSLA